VISFIVFAIVFGFLIAYFGSSLNHTWVSLNNGGCWQLLILKEFSLDVDFYQSLARMKTDLLKGKIFDQHCSL